MKAESQLQGKTRWPRKPNHKSGWGWGAVTHTHTDGTWETRVTCAEAGGRKWRPVQCRPGGEESGRYLEQEPCHMHFCGLNSLGQGWPNGTFCDDGNILDRSTDADSWEFPKETAQSYCHIWSQPFIISLSLIHAQFPINVLCALHLNISVQPQSPHIWANSVTRKTGNKTHLKVK